VNGPKPRLVVLNPTCLELVEEHRPEFEALGLELVADPGWRAWSPHRREQVFGQAQALILPAGLPNWPGTGDMARHRAWRVLSIAASGHEWLDLQAATAHGIAVTNALPVEGAEVVADLAWGLLLAVARQIPAHHQRLQQGDGFRGMGASVWGKTMGIVGLGRIGKAVARRAAGFDMQVLAATPHPDRQFAATHLVEVVELADLLRRSDYVSLHARLNGQTRGMIGQAQVALMKPSAVLVNTARRELVDEEALTQALLTGRLAGAGLDDPPSRPDTPLLHLPNVVFTPHLGNRAVEGVRAVLRCAVANAVEVLQGRRPASLVNPEVWDLPPAQRRFALAGEEGSR
jgi:D-3-phosphoglycerate dehydrogenase